MKEMKKYRGVVVPMVTPVTEDGTLDVEAVKRIVGFFAEAGVAPLLMGTTGEGNSVSAAAGRLLVETAVASAAKRVLIYAGLTGNCFEEQVTQADAYLQAGADVIVATLPSYYALTAKQMLDYYTSLADHPRIVGLKDSERDLERMAACIKISKERADFSYFCGWAAQSASALQQGADGIVPSTGNFVPGMFQQLYEAALRGDMDTAFRLQQETDEIARVYQKDRTLGQSLTALKVMMQQRGLCEPWMLMPLSRLAEEEERAIVEKAVLYLTKR